jgi:hypothetical protein
VSDDIATHASAWRVATVYDVTLPPRDPAATDATTSWAMVIALLLLVPPLGWLQLGHRSDVDVRVRVAVAVVAGLAVAAAWATTLRVQPWT